MQSRYTITFLILCFINPLFSSLFHENHPQITQQAPIDPIKAYQFLDNALFCQFMSILGNFIQILLNREDPNKTKLYVGKIIEDVVTTAKLVTRKKYASSESLKNMLVGVLKYTAFMIQQKNNLMIQEEAPAL